MGEQRLEGDGFSVSFTDREVTAWGGLALLKRMLDTMAFRQALSSWGLPAPGSNRGYEPTQLIEQFIVSIGCGACRFTHAETVRIDGTLTRLFDWPRAAGHKAILRLFGRFDMIANERVQAEVYRWFFGQIDALKRVTLDVDSTVITRHGTQDGAVRGYNPNRRGRPSHHPLLAFVAEARMVANFWLRPGNTHSANNILQFLQSTFHHLGDLCPVGTKPLGCCAPIAASSTRRCFRYWKAGTCLTSLPPDSLRLCNANCTKWLAGGR
jgi:hypothetical protein